MRYVCSSLGCSDQAGAWVRVSENALNRRQQGCPQDGMQQARLLAAWAAPPMAPYAVKASRQKSTGRGALRELQQRVAKEFGDSWGRSFHPMQRQPVHDATSNNTTFPRSCRHCQILEICRKAALRMTQQGDPRKSL